MALEIFKLVGSIMVDNEKANESIQKTDDKAQGLGTTLTNGVATAGKWAVGLTTAAVGVGTAMVGMASKSAESLDTIQKESQKLGMSYEAYQKLSYAAELSGTSVDKLSVGMKNITNDLAENGEKLDESAEKYEALGVSIYDAEGNVKDAETVMQESLLALADMTDETERNALANDIFGKSYQDMLPLLNSGAEGINAMMQEAESLGIVMSDDAVNAGAEFQDTMTRLKSSAQSLMVGLGSELMPIIEEVVNVIISNMPTIKQTIEQLMPIATTFLTQLLPPLMDLAQQLLPVIVDLFNQVAPILAEIASAVLPVLVSLIQTIAPFVVQLMDALMPLVTDVLSALLPLLEPLVELLQPILDLLMALLEPIIQLLDIILPPLIEILVAFIAVLSEDLGVCIEAAKIFIQDTLIPAFQKAWDKVLEVKDGIKEAWENIKTSIGDTVDSIKNKVGDTFEALVDLVKKPINTIIDYLNKFIQGVNKIKIDLPTWAQDISGMTSFGFNIPEIPKLAKGGDISGTGSAIVGEAGAELIDLPAGARVTPLTSNGGGGSVEDKMNLMCELLEELIEIMPSAVAEGVSGLGWTWNERELGRFVSND